MWAIILYCTGQDEDYISGSYSVTFTAGMTTASLSIPIKDDNVFEDTESFRLLIDSTSLPNDVTLGNPRSAAMTIVDDDGKSVIQPFIIKYSVYNTLIIY